MKISQGILYGTIGVLILVIILLVPKACNKEITTGTKTTTKTKYVPYQIPSQSGGFTKPTNESEIPISKPDTVFIAGVPVYIPSPLDEALEKELAATKSENERYKVLAEAARERKYSNDFEDEFVSINVESSVFGRLKNNEIKYKLKEREVQVPVTTVETVITKKDNFGILGGFQYKQDLSTQKSILEANAGVRVGSVNIIGSYNTERQVGGGVIIEF